MELSGELHASAVLPLGKGPWLSLDRTLRGSQIRFGHGGEEIKFFTAPAENRTPVV